MVKIKINFFFFFFWCDRLVASLFFLLGPIYCVDGLGIVIFWVTPPCLPSSLVEARLYAKSCGLSSILVRIGYMR
jgi:hypothetical protein